MFHRGEQHDRIVHRAADDATDQQPDEAGQVTVLGGKNRADQRAGSGDSRKMLAGIHPLLGGHVIASIRQRV
ncbi:hypothetical protein D3C87_2082640 [compost metagenome]